jgi:hypothetical protein
MSDTIEKRRLFSLSTAFNAATWPVRTTWRYGKRPMISTLVAGASAIPFLFTLGYQPIEIFNPLTLPTNFVRALGIIAENKGIFTFFGGTAWLAAWRTQAQYKKNHSLKEAIQSMPMQTLASGFMMGAASAGGYIGAIFANKINPSTATFFQPQDAYYNSGLVEGYNYGRNLASFFLEAAGDTSSAVLYGVGAALKSGFLQTSTWNQPDTITAAMAFTYAAVSAYAVSLLMRGRNPEKDIEAHRKWGWLYRFGKPPENTP